MQRGGRVGAGARRDYNTVKDRRRRLLLAGEVLQHPQLPRLLELLSSGGQLYAKLPSVMCEAVVRAVVEGSPGFAGCAGARAGMLAGMMCVLKNFSLENTALAALRHAAAPHSFALRRQGHLSDPVGDSVTKVLGVNSCGSVVVTCEGDMEQLCGYLSRHLSALATADPTDEAPPEAADPEHLEAAMAAAAQELLGASADAVRLRNVVASWTSLQLCVVGEAVMSGGQPGQQEEQQQQAEQEQGQQPAVQEEQAAPAIPGPGPRSAAKRQAMVNATLAATAQADAAVAQKGGAQAVVDRVAVWVARCQQQAAQTPTRRTATPAGNSGRSTGRKRAAAEEQEETTSGGRAASSHTPKCQTPVHPKARRELGFAQALLEWLLPAAAVNSPDCSGGLGSGLGYSGLGCSGGLGSGAALEAARTPARRTATPAGNSGRSTGTRRPPAAAEGVPAAAEEEEVIAGGSATRPKAKRWLDFQQALCAPLPSAAASGLGYSGGLAFSGGLGSGAPYGAALEALEGLHGPAMAAGGLLYSPSLAYRGTPFSRMEATAVFKQLCQPGVANPVCGTIFIKMLDISDKLGATPRPTAAPQAASLADSVAALEAAVQPLQGVAGAVPLRAAAWELVAAVRAQAPADTAGPKQGGL